MNKNTILAISIIGWTILGFVFQLDLTQRWGCIIISESYLIPYRISFSAVSTGILGTGILIKNLQLKKKLFVFELGFWISIFIFIKGGYAVGFAGGPDEIIMGYDVVAIFLRLLNISSYFQYNHLLKEKKRRIIVSVVVAIILIVVKANEFPLPIINLY